ncbi:MAG: histidinol-phosphate transaminase [Edaphobacter sp.]|uniref:pyridoxal phosphate-dependent aminotransferase n=1 Tax=Edaphobacter sp. TaxID=1934404 RepID=UPI0023891127|nr:histidinol-phosphate transaminase [Edaphobacter sp.]MDE1178238.1 histidinol-phosphate transaminase [Edaphobacter sp.]
MESLTRRSLLKKSSLAVAMEFLPGSGVTSPIAPPQSDLVHLNLNENAFGPSPKVRPAIEREFARLSRYGDNKAVEALTGQIADYERVDPAQVVLGENLGALGLYLGSEGGPGGEFIYSTPGYLALIDSASRVGGIGVPVPLNGKYENDLLGLRAQLNAKTRAVYLINPHNPTGTVSDDKSFKDFLRDASDHAAVIVDEAYLEFTPDFWTRSAVSLVRDGANVLVFRTFDKIHGLAGLPIGYTLAPKKLAATLRGQGLGDAESLGRLNMAAASAALSDRDHTDRVRIAVASERQKWFLLLEELRIPHTQSVTNFVFFDTARPQVEVAARMKEQGVQVARAFSPYSNWVRVTIGTPTENEIARHALRQTLRQNKG